MSFGSFVSSLESRAHSPDQREREKEGGEEEGRERGRGKDRRRDRRERKRERKIVEEQEKGERGGKVREGRREEGVRVQ